MFRVPPPGAERNEKGEHLAGWTTTPPTVLWDPT